MRCKLTLVRLHQNLLGCDIPRILIKSSYIAVVHRASRVIMDELCGQDDGWLAWIAVLAMWTRGVVWPGVTKGLGVMLPSLQDQFGTNAATMGLITSAIFATSQFTGL